MRKIHIEPHLTIKELQEKMDSSEDKKQFRRWQAIYLILSQQKRAKEVAEITRVTKGTIYQWVYIYNHQGPEGLELEGRGGRRNAYLSKEEEKELLDELKEDAQKGLIIVSKAVKHKAEEKLGHSVSVDYAYDLLHRHGWRKVSPRPKHPKKNKEAAEKFKKNFLP